jgi:ribosomal protein L27
MVEVLAMKSDEFLTEITCRFIIPRGGRILIKQLSDKWFLHAWSNIAAGPDHAVWGRHENALEFFDLKWALTIAPLYKAKVLVVFPRQRIPFGMFKEEIASFSR